MLERPPEVVELETRTILELLSRQGITDGKLLELACGTSPHGLLLSRAGYQMTGVDRAPAMLAEARRRAHAQEQQIRLFQADVVDFDLEEDDFSAAIFMFETFPLISNQQDVIQHFAALRRHLKSGAAYIIDIDTPQNNASPEAGKWGRRIIRVPEGTIETWYEDLPGDPSQEVVHLVLHCRIMRADQVCWTRDVWHVRRYSPTSLSHLAEELVSWRMEGLYSWRNPENDFVGEGHYFAVFLAC